MAKFKGLGKLPGHQLKSLSKRALLAIQRRSSQDFDAVFKSLTITQTADVLTPLVFTLQDYPVEYYWLQYYLLNDSTQTADHPGQFLEAARYMAKTHDFPVFHQLLSVMELSVRLCAELEDEDEEFDAYGFPI